MHIKTRLDLIMDALTASNAALRYVEKDIERTTGNTSYITVPTTDRIDLALEKIEKAFEAVNGTEERPGT